MNTQETIIQLKELKLKGMANTLESLMTLPVQSRPSFDFAIAKMVEAEILERKERKTEMFLKTSKLRYSAMIEDVACGAERNITTEQLAALADCSFIRRHENLLIQGKCGCGKTFLACAIGRQACTLGFRTVYLNMNRFIEKITLSKLDNTFLKMITSLEKNDLIILDDFGLQPMDTNTRLALLQILEERYERKSMIIASQLPISKWYDYIGDPTLADAIMDRLVANANKIELKGESMRTAKEKIIYICKESYRTECGTVCSVMTVPIAALQWYRLQCYAWYRFSAIVTFLSQILVRAVSEEFLKVVSA